MSLYSDTDYCPYGYPLGGERPSVRWCSLRADHPGLCYGADETVGFTKAMAVRRPSPADDVEQATSGTRQMARTAIDEVRDVLLAALGIEDDGRTPLIEYARQLAAKVAPPPAAKPDLFLVWSNRNQAWWRPNGAGYTGDSRNAGLFTAAEATKHCNSATWEPGQPAPEVSVLYPGAQRMGEPGTEAALRMAASIVTESLGVRPARPARPARTLWTAVVSGVDVGDIIEVPKGVDEVVTVRHWIRADRVSPTVVSGIRLRRDGKPWLNRHSQEIKDGVDAHLLPLCIVHKKPAEATS